jgi:ABC-type lipoprotein release transport system permease subunit
MEVLKLTFSLSWRNLWRNYRRSLILIIAVSVGVWSLTSTTSFMQAWSDSTLQSGLKNLTGDGQIHSKSYEDDPTIKHVMNYPNGELLKLLESSEVSHYAPRVNLSSIIQSEYETYPITLVGIEPSREQNLSFIPDSIAKGRYLKDEDSGVIIGEKLAKHLQTEVGRRVVLMSESTDGTLAQRGFKVVGIFSSNPNNESSYIFITLKNVQKMLKLDNNITGVSFKLHDMSLLDSYISKIKKVAPELEVYSWQRLLPLVSAMTQLSDSFIFVWLVIMFILLSFGIVNTILMALFERTRELGLLQALGLKPKTIFWMVMLETTMLIGFGVIVGLILGAITILSFHNGIDLKFLAAGSQWLGAGEIWYPKFNVYEFFSTGIAIWVLGIIATVLPVYNTIRKTPIDAINKG